MHPQLQAASILIVQQEIEDMHHFLVHLQLHPFPHVPKSVELWLLEPRYPRRIPMDIYVLIYPYHEEHRITTCHPQICWRDA